MSIDFGKAPKGATHYAEVRRGDCVYYKTEGDTVYYWDRNSWVASAAHRLEGIPVNPQPIPTFEPFVGVEDAPNTGSPTYAPGQLEWATGVSTKFDHLSGPEKALAIASFVIGGEMDKAREAADNFGGKRDPATAKQASPKGVGAPILGMVLADLTNRALEGRRKYGEPLLAHNGRNPLWDAYQEALDLAMYLRQAIEESK